MRCPVTDNPPRRVLVIGCRSGRARDWDAMYFDRRLWELTRGLRGWIALAIILGLVASVVGIARFAILGVLLSHVFSGAGVVAVALPALGVAAAVILRGYIEHHRAMITDRTAARVQ